MANPRKLIPKKQLKRFYLQQRLSSINIAKFFKCAPQTIRNRIKEFGIPKHSASEARMRYAKFNFTGNCTEKAYTIGFRLGDLNVYKGATGGKLIVARCNTTQQVQIKLIRKIFSKYGHITTSPGKDSTNVNVYLNDTFKFLLPKELPSWVEKNNKAATAFIAGYVDAEGNFLINQGKARFKIDSYDEEILRWMEKWARGRNLVVRFRQIAKQGDRRPDGKTFNQHLWRLNINNATSLMKFIFLTLPHSLHAKRARDMKLCLDNIRLRIRKGSVHYATI